MSSLDEYSSEEDAELDLMLTETISNLKAPSSYNRKPIDVCGESPTVEDDIHLHYNIKNVDCESAVSLVSTLIKERSEYCDIKAAITWLVSELGDDIRTVLDVLLGVSHLKSEHPRSVSTAAKLIIKEIPEDGNYSESLLADYIEKIAVDLPSYLFSELYSRLGVQIPRQRAFDLAKNMLAVKGKVQLQKALQFIAKTGVYDMFSARVLFRRAVSSKLNGAMLEFITLIKKHGASKESVEEYQQYMIKELSEKSGGDSPDTALRFMEAFGLSYDDCPRVLYLKRKKLVRWLISIGRFFEFEDALLNGSDNDYKLRMYACQILQNFQYFEEGLLLARKYGVEDKEGIRVMRENVGRSLAVVGEYDDLNEILGELPVLQLPHEHPILFVDSIPLLEIARSCLESGSLTCVGLDVELRPFNFFPRTLSCQTLQISTPSRSFIFDLQVLCEIPDFDTILSRLFRRQCVTKVGMGFIDGDLRSLNSDFPTMESFCGEIVPYFELNGAFEMVETAMDKKIKYLFGKNKSVKRKEGGLSKVTRKILGLRLDKTEQISDWSRRPLRQEQLTYAALDAYVCTLLFAKYSD